jgi:hypothetical protein
MLPLDFVFSQNNLQLYVDCKHRFYLHEILKLDWPANDSEPVKIQEERMMLGTQFHLICSQYFSGIPAEKVEESIQSPEIMKWWRSFLDFGLMPSPDLIPEKAITVPFSGYHLTAHFDLLQKKSNDTYVIFDWKTNTKYPPHQRVAERMQTLIYPVVLDFFLRSKSKDKPLDSRIEMIYWYPEFPDKPHRFTFTRETLEYQKTSLHDLIVEISQNSAENFSLTDEIDRCKYCQYRSYCNRGIMAGEYMDHEIDDSSINLV